MRGFEVSLQSVLILTSIFGGYDELSDIKIAESDRIQFKCLCISDEKATCTGNWEWLGFSPLAGEDAVANRYIKICALDLFPEFDFILYLDGNLQVDVSFVYDLLDSDGFELVMPRHPWRGCVYDEVGAAVRAKKLSREEAQDLLSWLTDSGVPKSLGLTENNVIWRKNTQAVRHLCSLWWAAYLKFPSRDQLTLMPILWSEKSLDILTMCDIGRGSAYVQVRGHKESSSGFLAHWFRNSKLGIFVFRNLNRL